MLQSFTWFRRYGTFEDMLDACPDTPAFPVVMAGQYQVDHDNHQCQSHDAMLDYLFVGVIDRAQLERWLDGTETRENQHGEAAATHKNPLCETRTLSSEERLEHGPGDLIQFTWPRVTPTTPLSTIAVMLPVHRIPRVFVVSEDGRLLGSLDTRAAGSGGHW